MSAQYRHRFTLALWLATTCVLSSCGDSQSATSAGSTPVTLDDGGFDRSAAEVSKNITSCSTYPSRC